MKHHGVKTLVLLAMIPSVAPRAVAAQSTAGTVQTQLGITAGQATDALGTHSSALTIAPTVMLRPTDRFAVDFGLQGTRFANEQWAATASGSAGLNLPLAPWLAFTANGHAAWTTTAYDARYSSVAAVPALEARVGRFTLFGGGQVAQGRSQLQQDATASPFPIGRNTSVSTVTTSRTLRGAVYGVGARFATPDVAGYIGYREDRARVGDLAFVDRALNATAAKGRLAYAASLGARVSGAGDDGLFASGSITADVLPGAALQVAASRYPDNYLTGTVAGNFVSIGVVLRTGRRPTPARGVQRVAIAAPRATRVEIAGDWNDWKPVPAVRAPDGRWYADVRLAPGRYRYAFRIDGSRWAVPDGVAAVDDDFGGRSAWLTVK